MSILSDFHLLVHLSHKWLTHKCRASCSYLYVQLPKKKNANINDNSLIY